MNTKKSFENRKTNALRRSLYFLSVMSLMSGCSLEDPAFTDYVDSNNQFITCENVKAIYFTDATITLSNHTYNGKDYSAAFKYNMCPAAAPNCIPDTENSHVCTSSCSNVCYGECVSDYIDINIVSCNHPDGKTITCVEGFADCDGNINNGCEFNLEAGNATDCHYDLNTGTVELVCETGLANCDNNYLNGCEYDLVTNKALSCVNHVVTCLNDAEFSDCDDNYKNGCEFDIVSHNAIACANKNITCRTGYGDCNNYYLDSCEIDLNSNLANCGACTKYTMNAEGNKTVTEDHACPSGQVCNGLGVCSNTCVAGSLFCGTSCVQTAANHIDVASSGCENLTDDDGNPYTRVYCTNNYSNCDDNPENGCEYTLSTNNAISCEHKEVLCAPSFDNCDGDYLTGCEYYLIPNHANSCTRTEEEEVKVTLDCVNDYADCDGDYTNGCEYQLSVNNAIQCENKIVTCDADFANCDGDYETGCEYNLSSHYATKCERKTDETSGEEYVELTCYSNRSDCDGKYDNGCEYDTKLNNVTSCVYNADYCSKEGIDCNDESGTDITQRGLIVCASSFADINKDYQDGCEVDTNTSLEYCGARGDGTSDDINDPNYKGEKCPAGYLCDGGKCGVTCTNPLQNCGGFCIDFTATNILSCLPGDKVLADDACVDGWADCDGELKNGCEYNLTAHNASSCKEKAVT